MKNKKAQATMEFLMTYGWAILVVLCAIGALAYFGVLNPEKYKPEPKLGFTCNNMKEGFPEIISQSEKVLQYFPSVDSITIEINKAKPSGSDEEGINCMIPAEVCSNNLLCRKIDMLVYINYTEWIKWKETK